MGRHQLGIRPVGEEASKPFWNYDEALCEVRIFDEDFAIQLKAHVSEERHHRAGELDERLLLLQ
jgi:hypothetical protein